MPGPTPTNEGLPRPPVETSAAQPATPEDGTPRPEDATKGAELADKVVRVKGTRGPDAGLRTLASGDDSWGTQEHVANQDTNATIPSSVDTTTSKTTGDGAQEQALQTADLDAAILKAQKDLNAAIGIGDPEAIGQAGVRLRELRAQKDPSETETDATSNQQTQEETEEQTPQATDLESETQKAWEDLNKAIRSGDPEEIGRATDRYQKLLGLSEAKEAKKDPLDRQIELSGTIARLEKELASASPEDREELKKRLTELKKQREESEKHNTRPIDERFGDIKKIREAAKERLALAKAGGDEDAIAAAENYLYNVNAYYEYLRRKKWKNFPKKILKLLSIILLGVGGSVASDLKDTATEPPPQRR